MRGKYRRKREAKRWKEVIDFYKFNDLIWGSLKFFNSSEIESVQRYGAISDILHSLNIQGGSRW